MKVVDLHVIKPGDLAQQPESLARLPQLLQLPLPPFEALRRERIEAVHLAGDQPNRLTVTGELGCLPGLADARKAELDIASRWVEELRNRFPTGTRYLQIARQVVHEEIAATGDVADRPAGADTHVEVGGQVELDQPPQEGGPRIVRP